MKPSQDTSQVISLLRFPLCAAVVMLHTYLIDKPIGGVVYVTKNQFPIFDYIEHIIRVEIANMAVPLFFFISGFLFFCGKAFTPKVFIDKLKKRFHSLFIPYVFWNTCFILFIALIGILYPTWLTEKRSILQMSFSEILNAYWDLDQGLIPLWFIRDLMILNLFAPVFYWMIKRVNFLIIVVLGLLWIFQIGQWLPGIGVRASFFYALGAWFSIRQNNFVEVLRPYRTPILLGSCLLIGINTYCWANNLPYQTFFQLSQMIGILGIILFTDLLRQHQKLQAHPFLVESSFFVFVFHMFVIKFPSLYWVKILPINTFTLTLVLFGIPLCTTILCVGIYGLMDRLSPRFTTFVIGKR